MVPELSVVIPLLDEAQSIEALCRELTETLEGWGRTFEVVFVDDGSTDGTFDLLSRLHAMDSRFRIIQFRRNFGQTAAFAAGFARARGRIIVTADGDLQNDLRDIPRMVDKLEEGYDIVCGWRKARKDRWLSRRLPSVIANALISGATGVRLHDYGCSLKVFRSEVVKSLRLYGEMHRFIPAIASEQGVRIVEVVVNHRPRRHGRSKYGISRTVRVLLDLATVKFLLTYSTRPLQIFGLVGLLMGAAGTVITGWLGWIRLFGGQPLNDRPLLMLGILLLFTGVQLVTLGLLAEMQARTYHESQEKPTYYIRKLLDTPIDEPVSVPPDRLS
jgi:glycosyltransferase involved in cell wall biosynthesis